MTTRPFRHVATKLAKRLLGCWALTLYVPLGTSIQMTPPSVDVSVIDGSGITSSLK